MLRAREDLVGVQVGHQPDEDDHSEQDEAGTISHASKEGQQEDPEGQVISRADQGQRMCRRLPDRIGIRSMLPKPCEPHGGMIFNDQSVKHADDRQPDQAAPFHPERGGEGVKHERQGGQSQTQCKQIVPTYS